MTKKVMTTLVYVGPSLSAAEVQRLLPAATILPPVAVGDVLKALPSAPARIAIIDGYFERMAAVWHKEILHALERGIEVWGASSMGALRAAELAPFGMRGVGAVYKAYAAGRLVADDEVAVAHLPAEQGYRSLSTALVDLRDAIARAPMFTAAHRAHLVELAGAPFYRDRSFERLAADASGALPARTLRAFMAWVAATRPSRKAADARLLLRTLARTRPKKIAPLRVPRTWAFSQLEHHLAREAVTGRRRRR